MSGVSVEKATASSAASPSAALLTDNAKQGMSLQLVGGAQSYELEHKGSSAAAKFDSQFIATRIGLDYATWGTVYASLGVASAEIDMLSVDDDMGLHWDLGTYINIWEQRIEEPSIIESTIGLMFNTEVSGNYADGNGGVDTTWHQWLTSLAITLNVPTTGHTTVQQRRPESATYYVGPLFAYTDVEVDNTSSSFDSVSEFGFLAGAAINVTTQFTLQGEYRNIDDESGFLATVAYRF
jgi:opacity protein-like surface antigen